MTYLLWLCGNCNNTKQATNTCRTGSLVLTAAQWQSGVGVARVDCPLVAPCAKDVKLQACLTAVCDARDVCAHHHVSSLLSSYAAY